MGLDVTIASFAALTAGTRVVGEAVVLVVVAELLAGIARAIRGVGGGIAGTTAATGAGAGATTAGAAAEWYQLLSRQHWRAKTQPVRPVRVVKPGAATPTPKTPLP